MHDTAVAGQVVLSRGGYTSAIDLWSLGCIFGEMLQRVAGLGAASTPQLQVAPMFAIKGKPKTPSEGCAVPVVPLLLLCCCMVSAITQACQRLCHGPLCVFACMQSENKKRNKEVEVYNWARWLVSCRSCIKPLTLNPSHREGPQHKVAVCLQVHKQVHAHAGRCLVGGRAR